MRDLDSYYPSYDEYCEYVDRENRVSFSDYSEMKEEKDQEIGKYQDLLSDIKYTLEEKTTYKKKIQILKALIEDFEED